MFFQHQHWKDKHMPFHFREPDAAWKICQPSPFPQNAQRTQNKPQVHARGLSVMPANATLILNFLSKNPYFLTALYWLESICLLLLVHDLPCPLWAQLGRRRTRWLTPVALLWWLFCSDFKEQRFLPKMQTTNWETHQILNITFTRNDTLSVLWKWLCFKALFSTSRALLFSLPTFLSFSSGQWPFALSALVWLWTISPEDLKNSLVAGPDLLSKRLLLVAHLYLSKELGPTFYKVLWRWKALCYAIIIIIRYTQSSKETFKP